jgi:CelD/BcsL family acetyltransferase involved in cellulose biosynthesis
MTSPVPCWEEKPFVLNFRLGEVTLFSKRFRALVLRNHFFDLPPDPGEPPPPLERLGKGVDVIVTRSHPVREHLPAVKSAENSLRYAFAHYMRCHAALQGTFEDYLGKFGGKTRSTLKRKVKRFLDSGEGSLMREYRRPGEMAEFHRLARGISALTYQEKLFDAGLPGGSEFLAELVERAKRDAVRAYLLFLRGEPVAYLCCPVDNGVLLYDYLGYDPRQAELSPGTILQYLAFESLFNEQSFRAFDFTEGQGPHKRFFATCETLCADICYFPRTASARFWVTLHLAVDRVSTAFGRTLEKAGLKATIKRFIRRA